MDHVSDPLKISPDEREDLRVTFFRTYRKQPGFSSVAVRRGDQGAWYLDVGATGDVALPSDYYGLAVHVKSTLPAVNAVARLEQVA
jgi:hypothetical protein